MAARLNLETGQRLATHVQRKGPAGRLKPAPTTSDYFLGCTGPV